MSTFQHKTELECRYCGTRIWSKWSGHMPGHTCKDAGLVSREYDHEKREYVPAYPHMAIDETEYYCRILGSKDDYIVHQLNKSKETK